MVFYLVYGFFYLVSLLPMWALYALADCGFVLLYHIVRYRRTIVRKNLTSSFPNKTKSEIIKIEKDFYKWLADYFLESIKLLSISKKQLKKRLIITNAHEIEQCFENNQSCAGVLGHYCNWEWLSCVTIALKPQRKLGLIYKPLKNKAIDKVFYKLRSSVGGVPIAKNDILRSLIKYKSQGTMSLFGYIADQSPRWQNIHLWLPFLNHDTPVFTGSERIIKKMNNAVFYVEMSRPKRGYYTCTFKLITKEPNKQKDEHYITKQFFKQLEQTINKNPHLYLWTHNRWKRQRT